MRNIYLTRIFVIISLVAATLYICGMLTNQQQPQVVGSKLVFVTSQPQVYPDQRQEPEPPHQQQQSPTPPVTLPRISSSTISTNPRQKPPATSHLHLEQQSKQRQQRQVVGKSSKQCQYNYPSLFDLQFNNIHWQKFVAKHQKYNLTTTVSLSTATTLQSQHRTSIGKHNSSDRKKSDKISSDSNKNQNENNEYQATYYLYNAYYDDRWRGGLPSVRILAMIDRIHPPPTDCLLWSAKLHDPNDQHKQKPLVTRAKFVYAWYPKWGNYKDGLLQPWIVTCPLPKEHVGLVPDSVSLVEVAPEIEIIEEIELPEDGDNDLVASRYDIFEADETAGVGDEIGGEARSKRQIEGSQQQQQVQSASIAMPPAFSSSSSMSPVASSSSAAAVASIGSPTEPMSTARNTPARKMQKHIEYDCSKISQPITNNLPVYNQRPAKKQKFAVCVKGLDFPHEDISVRLIEWIELLNLLGAGKIFLYNLDVHENISKVLHYYQERGIVELSPLTLPGDQPNLPEYQHLYLKNRLTAKRQNELIPYNDCLYRNLNSYQYLALLDIDEIIMPLSHHNWYDLMEEVEQMSLSEQNYTRASYNVRNVYFFDDLAGPLGTTSTSSSSSSSSAKPSNDNNNNNANEEKPKQQDPLESGIPNYLHMMQHVYRSKNYTEPGQYVKCFHNTERVVSLHNHFPMNCFGQCTTYSIPTKLAHLQHYRKDCVGPLRQSCKNDFRVYTMRDTTIWKYKQQMIKRTTRVLNHLKPSFAKSGVSKKH